MPFADSRRLTGANLFFGGPGAILDTLVPGVDDASIEGWRRRVEIAAAALGWERPHTVARPHARGVSLAMTAPIDQLFLATEINEWALCASLAVRDPACAADFEHALIEQAIQAANDNGSGAPTMLPALDEAAALARFSVLTKSETNPRLRILVERAAARDLPHVEDDAGLTLGAGAGARTYPLSQLPAADEVSWSALHGVPTVMVTGSNGKTTTVRLLAAFARAHGRRAGYNCTDGVFLDDQMLASGDYSGPAGARLVLREPRTEFAVLETARGGILRRGLAVTQADVAVVTNVSADHFGEYGIDELAGLAQVKLVVAAAVKPAGLLVLNADDERLQSAIDSIAKRYGRCPPLGWFGIDAGSPALRRLTASGAPFCAAQDGNLLAMHGGQRHDLGRITSMPLTIDGVATYNIANIAGAALAALSLGIRAQTISSVLARFGSDPQDNSGRMMRFQRNGVTILIDYAHNPDGLRGFLQVAQHFRRGGRLGLLLGHAGNRRDEDIRELAQVAARFQPDLVVVKEDEAHLRGRAPGEVPQIIRSALLELGMADTALRDRGTEVEAVQCALAWARPGDVLALPVHAIGARHAVLDLLEIPAVT